MPLYQCISPQGLIDDSQRENIAAEITHIHSGATGAPPSIVTVVFSDADKGKLFNDGQASNRSVVVGIIRAGRPAPTRKRRSSPSSHKRGSALPGRPRLMCS
jgi:phenylpyruvate tautomerase PptA (4-oxalocrotonate tautomerase family)